ncbi:MAG: hypothetical protein ACI4K9_04085 [Candidatus Fimenecus sp.]
MVTVVFPGAENKACAKAVCAILERFGGAIFADETEISDFAPVASVFFVYNGERTKTVPKKMSVLLITDKNSENIQFDCTPFAYRILDADTVLKSVPNSITVGMGKDSDISVSSIEDTHLQICIQRPLKTFSGKEVLPCEFSVSYSEKQDIKTILFAFTVLLLCDKADTEKLTIQLSS